MGRIGERPRVNCYIPKLSLPGSRRHLCECGNVATIRWHGVRVCRRCYEFDSRRSNEMVGMVQGREAEEIYA